MNYLKFLDEQNTTITFFHQSSG